MIRTLKIFALFCLIAWSVQLSAQVFTVETVPDPKANPSSHYVSNPAGILSAATVVHIDSILGGLEDSATAQVAVVVLPSIGEAVPKDFANELFKKWGVGYASKDNGLLLLFVLDQRRVEFETGYGLEGVLPDITCGEIQRNKMVPEFRNGNYDAGMLAGVEAIAQTLLQPEAANEINANTVNWEDEYNQLDMGTAVVLSFMICFFLICLRALRGVVRAANSVKSQIDAVIRKKKGHLWYAFLMYAILPIGLAILLGMAHLYEVFQITFEEGLLIYYAYTAFLIWDSRSRRELVFDQLFGKMTDPQQYVRLQTVTRFYWFDAIFFPLPFLWFWYQNKKRLDTLRNHPRFYAPGEDAMYKVPTARKQPFLNNYQKVEEQLKTVEYDVWRNDIHDVTEVLGYESLSNTKYTCCDKCHSKAVAFDKEEILTAATTEKEGRSKRYYQCKACGDASTKEQVIPIIRPVSSTSYGSSGSSSGSSSWSSSSSSSGSSWGGGRSGGGGAGSSW